MSPKQTTLKSGSCNSWQRWRSVHIAISSILFLSPLKTFPVIPLAASLGFLWFETQRLHPRLTFLHAPYPLTGGRYEITTSLAQSPSPCLGPLMSLLKRAIAIKNATLVWTHKPELNTKEVSDKLSEYWRWVLTQPLLSVVAWCKATRRANRSRARPSSNIGI